jgi:hypothetical protein
MTCASDRCGGNYDPVLIGTPAFTTILDQIPGEITTAFPALVSAYGRWREGGDGTLLTAELGRIVRLCGVAYPNGYLLNKTVAKCAPGPCIAEQSRRLSECNEHLSGDGNDYLGCQNQAEDGRVCKPWHTGGGKISQLERQIWIQDGGLERPGSSLNVTHNYCRNPHSVNPEWYGSHTRPWCYVRGGGDYDVAQCNPLLMVERTPFPEPLLSPCQLDQGGPDPYGYGEQACGHSSWMAGTGDYCDVQEKVVDGVGVGGGNDGVAKAPHGTRCRASCTFVASFDNICVW